MAHENRTKKFTDAEFAALARNDAGDITDDLPMASIWMTAAQRDRLTGDDWQRCQEYDEEIRIMAREFFN